MSRDAIEAAASWLAAQDNDDFDWGGFTAWLEADPRHRVAFDELVLLQDRVAGQRHELAASAVPPARDWTRRRWAALATGAGAVAASLTFMTLHRAPTADAVWRTGEAQATIALGDGVEVRLAPRTALTARHGDPARLAVAGTAYFNVRHDPARTLAVTVGPLIIRDIGTRFDVTGVEGVGHVAVAEGRVTVAALGGRSNMRLESGAALTDAGGQVVLERADPGSIGGWRHGILTYDRAPIALVASDIERYSGRPVTVDPQLATTRFSGVLTIGDGSKLAEKVAAILGIAAARRDGGIRLEPRR